MTILFFFRAAKSSDEEPSPLKGFFTYSLKKKKKTKKKREEKKAAPPREEASSPPPPRRRPPPPLPVAPLLATIIDKIEEDILTLRPSPPPLSSLEGALRALSVLNEVAVLIEEEEALEVLEVVMLLYEDL